jgi:hypothetical protein
MPEKFLLHLRQQGFYLRVRLGTIERHAIRLGG